jgi:hypothetical protein
MNRRNRIRERQIIYARTTYNSIAYTMKKPSSWVKPGFITALTRFDDGEKLRQAREQNLIEWENRGKSGEKDYWYNIDSIHEKFFKK